MTPREYAAWSRLCMWLDNATCRLKDEDVESLLHQTAMRQPDALYLMAQRVLLLESELREADNEVAQARRARPQPSADAAPGISDRACSPRRE